MNKNTTYWRRWASVPENRAALRERATRQREAMRLISDLVKAQPCVDCGNRYPAVCMDWDHLPGTTKFHSVARLSSAWRRPGRLFAEIAKCDLVCANCHRIRTENRRN